MSDDLHELRIETVGEWAAVSAGLLGRAIRSTLSTKPHCLVALSGGSTPGPVFEALADEDDLDWSRVTLLQVDERLAPAGSGARNLTGQEAALGAVGATWMPLPVDRLLAGAEQLGIDVTDPSGPLDQPEFDALVADVLGDFGARLVEIADEPPVVDVVQLGLGTDGHTASLLPGDPAIDELRRYVALTGFHGGFRRLTMTRPVFDRARIVLWLARGASKRQPLGRLLAGDLSIPAGMLRPRRSVIVADTEAARQS